jgi:hypothetical protein
MSNNIEEVFSQTHHEIIKNLGYILSSLNANSGIMAVIMSWGDTMDSENTLIMIKDYVNKYINSQPESQ